MKKNLLLMMLCYPMVLAAQNGVTVSNLAVDAGTVTFNVSWETPMPVTLWSDTVWVFVDYNKNGVMERLPLLPGATLTATSAPDVGKVREEPGNNQGVWVAGNARSAGSFSATVKLLTAVQDVGGACVYASNYPPVGKYKNNVTEISFTGTPPYYLTLNTGTDQAYGNYNLLAGQTLVSFTDATGAPGITPPAPAFTPPFAASTQTWQYGSSTLTWSDWISAPLPSTCALVVGFTNATDPPNEYAIHETFTFYNISCLLAEADVLCPPSNGWRMPTKSDFDDLFMHASGAVLSEDWGLSGHYAPNWGWPGRTILKAAYEKGVSRQLSVYYTESSTGPIGPEPYSWGNTLRCVR
jgi:hypothetical protein